MKGQRLIVLYRQELSQKLKVDTDPQRRLRWSFLSCLATLSPDFESLCKSFGIARNWIETFLKFRPIYAELCK
jgi:hypothetical protein